MPVERRASLVRAVLRDAKPGTALTATAITKRLLDAGHDFGPSGTNDAARIRLTERTLYRLLDRDELAAGPDRAGKQTFRLPDRGSVRPATTDRPVAQEATQAEPVTNGSGLTSVAVFAASYVVGLLALFILIALFEVF